MMTTEGEEMSPGRKPERRVRNAVREEGVSDRIADDLRIIQIVILTKIASAKPRIYNRLQAFAARFNDTKQNNFGARRDNFSAVLIYNGGVDTVQLHFFDHAGHGGGDAPHSHFNVIGNLCRALHQISSENSFVIGTHVEIESREDDDNEDSDRPDERSCTARKIRMTFYARKSRRESV